ncbi:potassium-transporting ATPase subunit F [Candidatus Gracilibacteria bacterium]|jgi:K+-transporting ATPase KdpF subunit|nr:potassium-transporting ATPase subunit F [Candidatus Gracilibacteria bacterium]NJM87848.1 potassium-transporting ATPase subunit F [Hydrococcus sp. RU_2_2]NJP20720.1 potassium-transporting ATPase subunit F [Hydrococcus sp. CRU_1_1]
MKPLQFIENIAEMSIEWPRQKLPLYLFLALCCNLVLAPAVLAATGGDLSRLQIWAIALLGIVTITLSGYLFVVMFQPERF